MSGLSVPQVMPGVTVPPKVVTRKEAQLPSVVISGKGRAPEHKLLDGLTLRQILKLANDCPPILPYV
ncbi:MAG TPA: hypothetical protein PLI34_05850, partial [Saprospiraceae bacterium]|nr:hypothetical protein [Saprospiraceae bacterium]